jgi:hypothetical protein
MPFSTVEFGLLFASVLLIASRLDRFNGLHKTLHFMSSYLLCGFWTWNHVPLPFGISLLKGPIWQPPAATSFQSRGSKNAQPRPWVEHGTGNLRGTPFCARVSLNQPRIEKAQ